MLRKIRIAAAAVFFVCITLLFLDFTGTVHAWFGWMAEIQFLPALLAVELGIVVGLVALTLLFGRVYCSVICPLGVMQDIVSWFAGKRRKTRFAFTPQRRRLRYGVLLLFVVVLTAHVGSLAALIAPYSAYGRIASNLLAPIWLWGNNLLAYLAERADSYAFYRADVWMKGIGTFVVALATFGVLACLAWRSGRTWCNTICPVGTVLGALSRYSLFRPRIDTAKCNGCKLCARNCKSSCIDPAAHKIDYSRCVACMDCLDKCHRGAISYTWRRPHSAASDPVATQASGAGVSRRQFLSTMGLFAVSATVKAQEKKVDGGLAAIEEKKIPKRATSILPPGAKSIRHFTTHCTACQLCVAACPNGVLRPSGDLMRLMKPEMSYERGYCRPECAKCAEVCPTDAIRLTDLAEKVSTQVGHAVWLRENCVTLRDGVQCNNCARHCPTGAIHMVHVDVDDPESLRIPVVNEARCIGCGACENLCPARPFSAIYVEGHECQRTL